MRKGETYGDIGYKFFGQFRGVGRCEEQESDHYPQTRHNSKSARIEKRRTRSAGIGRIPRPGKRFSARGEKATWATPKSGKGDYPISNLPNPGDEHTPGARSTRDMGHLGKQKRANLRSVRQKYISVKIVFGK